MRIWDSSVSAFFLVKQPEYSEEQFKINWSKHEVKDLLGFTETILLKRTAHTYSSKSFKEGWYIKDDTTMIWLQLLKSHLCNRILGSGYEMEKPHSTF